MRGEGLAAWGNELAWVGADVAGWGGGKVELSWVVSWWSCRACGGVQVSAGGIVLLSCCYCLFKGFHGRTYHRSRHRMERCKRADTETANSLPHAVQIGRSAVSESMIIPGEVLLFVAGRSLPSCISKWCCKEKNVTTLRTAECGAYPATSSYPEYMFPHMEGARAISASPDRRRR